MEGFKIFNHDWTCLKTKYTVGKKHQYEDTIRMCSAGFHFCQRALDCLNYYPLSADNKYAKVKAYNQIITEYDKSVTNCLEIVEEIPFETFKQLCTGQEIRYH